MKTILYIKIFIEEKSEKSGTKLSEHIYSSFQLLLEHLILTSREKNMRKSYYNGGNEDGKAYGGLKLQGYPL